MLQGAYEAGFVGVNSANGRASRIKLKKEDKSLRDARVAFDFINRTEQPETETQEKLLRLMKGFDKKLKDLFGQLVDVGAISDNDKTLAKYVSGNIKGLQQSLKKESF